MMWWRSVGASPAISSARCDANSARSDAFSSGPTMRRSEMTVRSRIHSSDVSTIRSRSKLLSTRSGTCMPVPTMVTPRISGSGFTIGLDLLSNVLVDALLDAARDGADRAADRLGAAAAVADEADAVDPQQGRGGVLLPVELTHQPLERRSHQDRSHHGQRVSGDLGADLLEEKFGDTLGGLEHHVAGEA